MINFLVSLVVFIGVALTKLRKSDFHGNPGAGLEIDQSIVEIKKEKRFELRQRDYLQGEYNQAGSLKPQKNPQALSKVCGLASDIL